MRQHVLKSQKGRWIRDRRHSRPWVDIYSPEHDQQVRAKQRKQAWKRARKKKARDIITGWIRNQDRELLGQCVFILLLKDDWRALPLFREDGQTLFGLFVYPSTKSQL